MVKLVGGSLRGTPYPDPAPIAPLLITYALYVALYVGMPERNTPGEKLHAIEPVTSGGRKLTTWRWMARLVFVSALWSGSLLLFDTQPNLPVSVVVWLAAVLGAVVLYGLADLFMLFVHRVPRSLTDRLLRIAVVYLPPVQPHRAPAGPMYSAKDREFGP